MVISFYDGELLLLQMPFVNKQVVWFGCITYVHVVCDTHGFSKQVQCG